MSLLNSPGVEISDGWNEEGTVTKRVFTRNSIHAPMTLSIWMYLLQLQTQNSPLNAIKCNKMQFNGKHWDVTNSFWLALFKHRRSLSLRIAALIISSFVWGHGWICELSGLVSKELRSELFPIPGLREGH